ncbi:glycoprotein X [Akanthomyces lecanii RCEF 1005]|uniref:Glycoprotein X n=1 Tax=Akanthomyces lecanii RCEF 1005 TaxID=1081108 RepID=A0A168GNZ7_CORDF|nr:glycoprotein X [Akanthomyces lecanii RCEF 1005]
MASVMRMACANMELIPRQVNVQEPAAEFVALCPTCCTNTILRTTIKETFFSTKTQTVYLTATQHDVSTQIQHETEFVTKTSVSTFTTSYPVTVTRQINCTKKPPASSAALKERTYPISEAPLECDTVTITEWRTTTTTKTVLVPTASIVPTTEWRTATATKTVLVPTVSLVPTTMTNIETVTQTGNQSVTVWLPTTYTTTITRTSLYPITVTSEHDLNVTSTATSTETIIKTITTSYPVVTHDTITVPGSTVTRPGSTVTQPGLTFTVPGSTVTLPGSTITQSGSTVVLPGSTVVLPGTTVTATTRITVCPSPTGFSAPLDPSSNLTFGCSPGSVCAPRMPAGCNLWPGPPSDDFLCCASDCVPSPPFTLTHWRDNETSYYPPSPGYYNLDPTRFGLTYDIFESPDGRGGGQQGLQSPVKRATAPSQCFDECNNVFVTAEAGGKTDELCRAGSPFRIGFDLCTHCIELHASVLSNALDDYVGPVLAQFLNFCKGRRSVPQSSSVDAVPGRVTTAGPEPKTSTQTLQTSTQVSASSGSFESPPPSTASSQTTSASASVSQSSAAAGDAEPSAKTMSSAESSVTANTSSGGSSVKTSSGSASSSSTHSSTKSGSTGGGSRSTPSGSTTRAAASGSTGTDTGNASKTTSTTASDSKATPSTGSDRTSSPIGTVTAATATPESTSSAVVANGAAGRFEIGGALGILVTAMAVFILI